MEGGQQTAYELERERRVAENKKKMEELGIHDSVAAVQQLAAPKPAPKKRKSPQQEPQEPAEVRRSQRPRAEINYARDLLKEERAPRDPIDYTEKIKSLQLDAEAAEKLRAELEAKRSVQGENETKSGGKNRGPKDSGKGVRVQGGRVYDSAFGVTCHWCRQKTLEAHVTCTHPKCSKSKMPYSFCHKCLKNRHGEDAEAAAASGNWVCPTCRGSCGPGCVTCCNCGPCRKKASLEPTAQIVFLARSAGFSNVHDYLVHLVTGEKEEEIAARKAKHDWGAWLRDDPSEDSAQTLAGAGSQGSDANAAGEEAAAAPVESEEEQELEKDEGQQPTAKKGRKSSAKKGSKGAKAEAATKPGAKGKKPAARKSGNSKKAAAPADADAAGVEVVAGGETAAAAAPQRSAPSSSPEDASVAADQDGKLSRKARMMQRMGLALRGEAVAA